MKKLMLLLLVCCSTVLFAQHKPFVERSDSDSKKILTKLQTKYESYKGIQAKYSLVIKNSEKEEKQYGKILQQDGKYRIDHGGNLLISDGETVWTYTKSINEVQINSYDPDDSEDEMLSPDKILKVYENEDDFLIGPPLENGSEYAIEMKPKDSDAEFFKIRVTISKSSNDLKQVIIFGHHNVRYTFNINEVKSVNVGSSNFKFDEGKFPGVEKVDLRD